MQQNLNLCFAWTTLIGENSILWTIYQKNIFTQMNQKKKGKSFCSVCGWCALAYFINDRGIWGVVWSYLVILWCLCSFVLFEHLFCVLTESTNNIVDCAVVLYSITFWGAPCSCKFIQPISLLNAKRHSIAFREYIHCRLSSILFFFKCVCAYTVLDTMFQRFYFDIAV